MHLDSFFNVSFKLIWHASYPLVSVVSVSVVSSSNILILVFSLSVEMASPDFFGSVHENFGPSSVSF